MSMLSMVRQMSLILHKAAFVPVIKISVFPLFSFKKLADILRLISQRQFIREEGSSIEKYRIEGLELSSG